MAARSASWLYEKKPLKKQKLGAPDVYPQEAKQREDELTALNVKQGFLGTPAIADEYGSARNSNITSNKFVSFFSSLLAKKQELSTFQDKDFKKKPLASAKDSVILVTPRTKPIVDAWFKDLATGSRSLAQLSRKVPIFNKKEEVLSQMYDSNVPMYKAAFYVKASYQYSSALSESGTKGKKRLTPDPGLEWTPAICKYLRDIFNKLAENSSGQSTISPESQLESLQQQWYYFTQFARYMFEENLLEKHDFLTWLVGLFEKIKPAEDSILRLIAPLLLDYAEDFAEYELLSRKLAFNCAERLNQLFTDPATEQADSRNSPSPSPTKNTVQDLLSCPQHRSLAITLSAVVQIITLKCRSALVWHPTYESRTPHSLVGSPLDHLPYPPSCLPMAKCVNREQIIAELREAEEEIRLRSIQVENKWASERLQSSTGSPTTRLLEILDILDRHSFDRIEANNTLDVLYSRIFTPIPQVQPDEVDSEFIQSIVSQDEPKIKILCEWAVTSKRSGEHRSMVVAKLLEKRQNELIQDRDMEVDEPQENGLSSSSSNKNSANTCNGTTNGLAGSGKSNSSSSISLPVYQNIIFSFLDTQAPVLDERNPRNENRIAFSNLVLLFSELIRCEVFSHDQFMCTLISRGYFSDSSSKSSITTSTDAKGNSSSSFLTGFGSSAHSSNSLRQSSSDTHNPTDSLPMFNSFDQAGQNRDQMDLDDDRIDAELNNLVQNIKEGQQQNNMHDHDILLPDAGGDKDDERDVKPGTIGHSNSSTSHHTSGLNALPSASLASNTSITNHSQQQRHLLYTLHFPLQQDDSMTHECNQRHILLYGFGKARDEARHAVKKVTKEILRLFSRKTSMAINEGGKVKKSLLKDGFNFETTLARFQALPFFDQNAVTVTCANTCIEMLNSVATGAAPYLPLVESIAFLFDLMEMALNVHGMIEFIINMLKELVEVENQLRTNCPIYSGSYTCSIGLYIVGVLFRYQPCLMVSTEDTFAVFEGCYKMVKHVTNPADCSSAERCILGFLFDLFSSCAPLRAKYHEALTSLMMRVKQVIYAPILPSNNNLLWNQSYMIEYINNPKSKLDPNVLKQLNENPNCRFSFVCNAVRAIATTKDANLLNELSILCAELSARCAHLSNDWIGILKAHCCSSNHLCGFMDALNSREINDHSIHDNLAIFTSILVARRCFSLQDFVIHCALPSLLAACPQGGGDSEAESGARLTCHLLLCLFRTSEPPLSSTTVTSTPATTLYSLTSPGPANLTPNVHRPSYIIKHPCDRYLLAAAHSCMRVEAVIAVLKAILVLGDSNSDSSRENRTNSEVNVSDLLGHIDDDFNDFLPNFSGNRSSRIENIESAGLGEFAKHALKQICSQEWVHEKCLRDPEMLCKPDLLLDTMLTSKQAQQLLEMICHPKAPMMSLGAAELDHRQYINKILHNLDEWTLRISWLQLQLIYAQCSQSQGGSQTEVNTWLENVAKTTIEFFQSCSEESSKVNVRSSAVKCKSSQSKQNQAAELNESKETRVFLVSPLISKLPYSLQGKILRVAATVLETGNWMSPVPPPSSYKSKGKDRFSNSKSNQCTSTTLLSYPPFLSLVLMCLKEQDEQRESLLKSLYTQLEQAIHERPSEDLKTRLAIHDGLQLRLSLVGSMFDMIVKSNQAIQDWSILLLNFITIGVVDAQLNYELFATIVDMLAVLIHSTQTIDPNETREESKKQYVSLLKKLRKDLPQDYLQKNNFVLNSLKQLVPVSKQFKEVITCEPMGSLIDTKGNKIAGFESIDKKQGLQVAEKKTVSPWDLIEGSKSPAPLCWTWFGVVKYDRKPLGCEQLVNALQWHTHSLKKATSYFLEPPPIPPEIEPAPAPEVVHEVAPVLRPIMTAAPAATVPIPPSTIAAKPPPPPPPPPHHTLPTYPPLQPTPEEIDKRETSTPSDLINSPRSQKTPKPKQARKRRTNVKNSPVSISPGQATPPIRMPNYESVSYGAPQVGPGQQGPPHQQNPMYNSNQMPGQPQQGPYATQNFYPHQNQPMPHPQNVPMNRMDQRPPGSGQGKAAVEAMLRARTNPGHHQFVPPGNPPTAMMAQRGPSMPPQRTVMRQVAPQQQMMMQQGPAGGMYQLQQTGPGPQNTVQQHQMGPGPNTGGYPMQGAPNIAYQQQMQMPPSGPSMESQSHSNIPINPGYAQQAQPGQMQQQPNQMMRQPMQTQMQPQQQQFIQRSVMPQAGQANQIPRMRAQYQMHPQNVGVPNVTMGPGSHPQGFPQQNPQGPAPMNQGPPNIRAQTLQRQLSGQGPGQQNMNPYQHF